MTSAAGSTASALDNYRDVFDSTYIPVLVRSVAYALATVILCLLIGYPVAYFIARYGGRYRYALVAALVIPFFVNYLVRTYAWVALLADQGLVNNLLVDWGLTECADPDDQHSVRGDRRTRLRLHHLHDPAALRIDRTHGSQRDRGRQGSLRIAASRLSST